MNSEKWKDIPGYDGSYQISDLGHVRSFKKTENGELLCPKKDRYVNLRKNGKERTTAISLLVAKAFIPNPNNYRYVKNINGILTDNYSENLKWVKKQPRHGTGIYKTSRPVYCEELDEVWPSATCCGKALNIPASSINMVCSCKRNTAHGFHFYYI